jgi:hypothetical protein
MWNLVGFLRFSQERRGNLLVLRRSTGRVAYSWLLFTSTLHIPSTMSHTMEGKRH